MDLVVFENNKALVLDEFRAGRFDYVELASDVAETKFFHYLFGERILDQLAEHYPRRVNANTCPCGCTCRASCRSACTASTAFTAIR